MGMKLVLDTIIVLLVILAALAWFQYIKPSFEVSSATSHGPFSFQLRPYEAGPLAAKVVALPEFNASGIYVRDTTEGFPGTGYFFYQTKNHAVASKELLFPDSDSCDVSEGHLPCAPYANTNQSQDSANLPTVAKIPNGAPIHIEGANNLQAIQVNSVSLLPNTSSNEATFSVPLGGSATLSNGLILSPTNIRTDAACTFGYGCYGDGTPRAEVTLTASSTLYAEFAPARTVRFGTSSIVFTGFSGSSSNPVLGFAVFAR
jgi:hypothetical protein